MKRKASGLDEQSTFYTHQQQNSPFLCSSASMDSNNIPTFHNTVFQQAKYPSSTILPHPLSGPDSEPAPLPAYFNTRTLKRHRDNRPDESTIHATTLARLFDAQRRQPHTQTQSQIETLTLPFEDQDQEQQLYQQQQQDPEHPDQQRFHTSILTQQQPFASCTFDQPVPLSSATTDPTQRSIDSFFPQSRDHHPKPARKTDASSFSASTTTTDKMNTETDHSWNPTIQFDAHPLQPFPTTMTTTTTIVTTSNPYSQLLFCEDCTRPLPTESAATDSMEIDLDISRPLSPSAFEEFECSRCSRRVCDLCAVRGDQRVCLECIHIS